MHDNENITQVMQSLKRQGLSYHKAKEELTALGYTPAQIADASFVYTGSSETRLKQPPDEMTIIALTHKAEAESARHMSDVANRLGPTRSGGNGPGVHRFRHYGPSFHRQSLTGFTIFVIVFSIAYWLIVRLIGR